MSVVPELTESVLAPDPSYVYSLDGGYTHNPAHSNELTTLPNREAFMINLGFAVRQFPGEFALVSMDVDGLGEANDEYGHDKGDHLLRSVASALFLDTRPTDSIAPKHVPNHISGDEFNILLPGASTQSDVDSFIDRMQSLLEAVKIRVSMAGAPHLVGETVDVYTKRIDDMLRTKKQNGIIARRTDEQKKVIKEHGLPIIDAGINPKHIRLLVAAGLQDEILGYLNTKYEYTGLDLRAKAVLGEMALSPLNPRAAVPVLRSLLIELIAQDTISDEADPLEEPTLF